MTENFVENKDTELAEDGTVTVDLYDAAEGKQARSGGPYLDQIEREQAERRRAKLEGREPDLDNPPAVAGTVLVTKGQLVERDTDKSHFTDAVEVTVEPVDSFEVQQPITEPDPTQADWDNDSDKLKGLQAAALLTEVTPVADEEGFTGVEDAADHIDTSTTGDNY